MAVCKKSSVKKAAAGFTLLEVIIAVTILAFLSIFTARMIQGGLQAKTKIQGQIDRTGQMTSALQLMVRDLEMAFHYRDFNIELYNAAQESRKGRNKKDPGKKLDGKDGAKDPGEGAGKPGEEAGAEDPYPPKEVKIYTRFFGEEEKINFTSLNGFRSSKNSTQSDQAEVGYRVDTCTSRMKKEVSSTCLFRRMSPYIDEDVTEGGRERVLLENVKSLKFRYLAAGEEEWVKEWKTEGGAEAAKDKFPIAVEITLTILDTRTDPPKDIAMTVVGALRFPNNKPDEASEQKEGAVN